LDFPDQRWHFCGDCDGEFFDLFVCHGVSFVFV
jgi:hypothetical protein